MKKNEILPFVTWMELEGIMPSEINQMENNSKHSCSVSVSDLVTIAEAERKIPQGCKAK